MITNTELCGNLSQNEKVKFAVTATGLTPTMYITQVKRPLKRGSLRGGGGVHMSIV